jgi:hypothetical protein
MSAAVWNEPQDTEFRCRDGRRTAGASLDADRNTRVLMICAPRRPAEPDPPGYPAGPRPAETTA